MTERLDQIRQRAAQATPGPWRCTSYEVMSEATGVHVICFGHDRDDYGRVDEPDAEFIAHAREDIPYLLQELATLSDRIAALEGALQRQTERACRFNCDAEDSACKCPAHMAYRAVQQEG